MAQITGSITTFALQNQFIKRIIETGKQFYNDPKQTYNSWTNKQRLAMICTSSLISLYILYKVKSSYTEYKLRSNGYRLLDLTSQGWELCQEVNANPTVTGFEICEDIFTFDHLKEFTKYTMKSFINYRSQIYKINRRWYFKEEFDPETQDMNEYCNYIQMECKEVLDDDTDNIIEEKILQTAVKYLNKNRAFNVKWNEYKRAHLDGYYFHFKKQKKCVLFFRFNHSMGDGILVATLVALLQNILYNPKYKDLNINFDTPNDDILPLLSHVLGNKVPKYSVWNTIYYYLHYPVAWIKLLLYVGRTESDRDCKFRGKFEFNNKLAVGRPISVDQFKSVAKKYNSTVNDLFQAISFGSLRRYATKYECQAFNDDNFHGIYTAIGIVNRRPLSPVKFAKELVEYATYGTNSNQIDFTPYYVSIKDASIKEAQKSFSKIKYGYTPQAFRSFTRFTANIPGGTKLLFQELGKSTTIVTSNLRGPANLIPLPGNDTDNVDDEKRNGDGHRNEYVSWLFGMAVPAMLPLMFTLMTYNKHIRVGILADNGSIQDPDLLMECFVDEWNQYNI